jgi:hypothetical protein
MRSPGSGSDPGQLGLVLDIVDALGRRSEAAGRRRLAASRR